MHLYCLEYVYRFLSAELKSTPFLKLNVHLSTVFAVYYIRSRQLQYLFCKMKNTHHCAHSLLTPVKSCTHYLRPKGHKYELPRCDLELYKNHLCPVASRYM